jgi:hypothetical protein
LVAVPLSVTSVADIPGDAYVLIEALPSGLVPAVGLHVANGVWKLEPDELEAFALVVGSSAPEFFAFTVSVFASDSTALGRSTAAVALRYSKRRMVTTAATSVVRTDSEAHRDAKLVAPRPMQPVSTATIIARVEPKAEKQAAAKVGQRVAAKPVVENDDEADDQEQQVVKVQPKARPLAPIVAKPQQLPQVADVRQPQPPVPAQPNVDLKMGVGVRMVPSKPMAGKPAAAAPFARPPGVDVDWKKDVRDSTGAR